MKFKTEKISNLISEISMGPFGSNIKVECFVDYGIPVLNGSNLDGIVLKEDSFRYVTEDKANSLGKANAHRRDVVVTHRGTLGQIIFIPDNSKFERYVISQSQFRVRCNEKLLPEYMVYYFHTRIGQHKLLSNASQVGVPALARASTTFQMIEIDFPDIETQRKIVDLLETIRIKIEKNKKINDNLYEQLLLSYKHDYIEMCESHPEWSHVILDDVTTKFATGLNPRKNFVLGHGTNYYVTIKNMISNRIYLNDKCDKVDDEALVKINNRSDLKPGDLLFSGIGTIGRTYLIDKPAKNWNISESVFTIRPSEMISSEFLFLLLISSGMQDYAISNSSGSVQKGIRMADLKKYRFICPSDEYMKILTNKWRPMISLIKQNEYESDSLEKLRDTLLPKLMSGELDVSCIDY